MVVSGTEFHWKAKMQKVRDKNTTNLGLVVISITKLELVQFNFNRKLIGREFKEESSKIEWQRGKERQTNCRATLG